MSEKGLQCPVCKSIYKNGNWIKSKSVFSSITTYLEMLLEKVDEILNISQQIQDKSHGSKEKETDDDYWL